MSKFSLRVIVSGGGTGGHIIPALALAKELISLGNEVLYIGNKYSLEEKMCHENNIPFFSINVQKLYRSFTLKHIKFPFKLIVSFIDCIKQIRKYRPSAFIGTGGFVCGPAGIASLLLNIPVYIQEQNCYPGITTRFLGYFGERIFLASKDVYGLFNEKKTIISGNPILTEKLKSEEKIDFNSYGLVESSKKILIIGGSQGSLFLNNLILSHYDAILEIGYEIIWQTGSLHLKSVKAQLKDRKGIYCFDFSTEMHKIYNSVHLAIGRAGALTISELEMKAIPAILIPLPTAAGNHQYYNALEFQKRGLGLVLEQKSKGLFMRNLEFLIESLPQYKSNFKKSLHEDASERIIKIIMKDQVERI